MPKIYYKNKASKQVCIFKLAIINVKIAKTTTIILT